MDRGGFQLMAHFSLNKSQPITNDQYDSLQNNPWTLGINYPAPLDPNTTYSSFNVQSHDWSKILQPGGQYVLRQEFMRILNGEIVPVSVFDATWEFVYPGFVDQSSAPNFAYQWWPLFNRQTIQPGQIDLMKKRSRALGDGDQFYFWPPFRANVSKPYMTGQQMISIQQSMSNRTFGAAGVIEFPPEAAPASGEWAPNFRQGENLVWSSVQDGAVWGTNEDFEFNILNYYIGLNSEPIPPFVAPEIKANPGASLSCFETPLPVAEWTFEDGTCKDTYNRAPGFLRGDARIEAGQLILNGNGYMETDFLGINITQAKTFEVGLYLDTIYQHGGSPMTLINTQTGQYDAISYGQSAQGSWWIDTENQTRNYPSSTTSEQDRTIVNQLIRLTFVYKTFDNNRIDVFRNGQQVDVMVTSPDNLLEFPGDFSKVLLGRRGYETQNAFISARIEYARLYNFAATNDDMRSMFGIACTESTSTLWLSPDTSDSPYTDGKSQETAGAAYLLMETNLPAGTTYLLQTGIHDSIWSPLSVGSGVTIEGNFNENWQKIPDASATTIHLKSNYMTVSHPLQNLSTDHFTGFLLQNVRDVTFRDLVIPSKTYPPTTLPDSFSKM
eukprot:TRINITY_DN259_c5_g1_i1.p1 TRINITY_DN259_c5_g1~~TRINITY_DN259_c5_g1_i1.p1  ORF type:complete len:666 (-),score=136.72 TRINITY_DN259_c5_g1_i1:31-1863(-)